jgi:hypothetical protein
MQLTPHVKTNAQLAPRLKRPACKSRSLRHDSKGQLAKAAACVTAQKASLQKQAQKASY